MWLFFQLEMRKNHENEEQKMKYKILAKENEKDANDNLNNQRIPKYSKSNNFSTLLTFKKTLSLSDSEGSISPEPKTRRVNLRRMQTNRVDGKWFSGTHNHKKKVNYRSS